MTVGTDCRLARAKLRGRWPDLQVMHEREKEGSKITPKTPPGRVGLLLLKKRETVEGANGEAGRAGGGAVEKEEFGLGCGFSTRERSF